jgi:transposase-like protein
MPKRYAREFRRAVCERLMAGERVSSLAKELEVSEPTLYLWQRRLLLTDLVADIHAPPSSRQVTSFRP